VTRAQPKAVVSDSDIRPLHPEPVGEASSPSMEAQRAAVDGINEPKVEAVPDELTSKQPSSRRRGNRRSRKDVDGKPVTAAVLPEATVSEPAVAVAVAEVPAPSAEEKTPANPRRRTPRRPRKEADAAVPLVVEIAAPVEAPKKRVPRSRKPKVLSE